MKWLRKTAAAILMLLAVLGLLFCIAGAISALVGNRFLSNIVVETITTVEGYFATIDQKTTRIEDSLASLHANVNRIQDQLTNTTISDAEVLRAIVDQIDSNRIGPAVERVIITAQELNDGLQAVNSLLLTVNKIPAINLPTLSEELAAVNERVAGLREDFTAIQTELSTSQNIKTRLLQPVNRFDERLNRAEESIAAEKTWVDQVQASLRSLRVRITSLILLSSLVVALFFTLFGVGQVLLIDRAWKWFKSDSPGKSGELQGASTEERSLPDEDVSTDQTT